jgi:uncharacterized membrane protein (GlpM family)
MARVVRRALVGTIVFAVLGFISTNGRRFAIVGIVFLLITFASDGAANMPS